MARLPRRSGILLHPTSLPGPHGSGDLGPAARAFIDALAAAGQAWWQMLPIGPTGAGNSPYSATSAFAGNPLLVSLEDLAAEGLLDAADLAVETPFPEDRVDFAAVIPWRRERLRRAFDRFRRRPGAIDRLEADARSVPWAADAALFYAIRAVHGERSWTDWPAPLRDRDSDALAAFAEEHAEARQFELFCQDVFARQWSALRSRARSHGVRLIGDLPIFVAHDSADVWANRSIFLLDATGAPTEVAGCPPDAFSEAGQLWGNPLYRWDVLADQGYGWWVDRVGRTLDQFDLVRLDHFIGFHRAWHIPAGREDGREGRFRPGPGIALFGAIEAELGGLPFVAEDLGLVTPEVHALRDEAGLPSMRVLQFAFGSGGRGNEHTPWALAPECAVYTGTHDCDTTVGWFRGPLEPGDARSEADLEAERHQARLFLASDGREIHWDLIRLALASVADTAIVPLQDVLGLDRSARMNRPGTVDGNWEWRARAGAFGDGQIARLRGLTETYGRLAAVEGEDAPA